MVKLIRRICAFFISLSFMCTIAPLVFADSNLSYFQHIKETGTWYRDMYRSAFWGILKLMGKVISYIEEAVKEVLSWNVYTKLTELDSSFSYENVKGVALIIVVVAISFAGILLMVNGDKMHIKDSVKNILVALCLIVGMPALMGALDDFMFGADRKSGYASEVGLTNHNATSEGTVITLGDKILSMQVYDNVASVKTQSQQTLYSAAYDNNGNEKKDTKFVSPQEIDINELASQKQIPFKYVSSEVNRTQRKYSDLTYENCADLLGMGAEYRKLIAVQDKIALSVKTNTSTSDDSSSQSKSKSEAEVKTDEYKFSYAFEKETRREWTVKQFEKHMIDILKVKTYDEGRIKVSAAKNYRNLNSNTMTFEQAIEAIKDDIIWELNYQENEKKASGKVEDVKTTKLRTTEDYKKLSWISQIVTVDMWEPNSDERVYAYDYDFFPAFVDMIIVIFCLIFALLKLCRMMWEIAFMHIFVPLVIATDAHGSGRAKRAVQHLITTFAILIVVLITLNLYLSLIGKMHEISNLIARWGLILAGAHFVIDGSDFIVKMTGMDAGVKSGAATLLGLRSAAGLAAGVVHTAASVAKTGAHVGGKAVAIGGKAADHVGGAVVGAAAGAVSGMAGGAISGGSGHENTAETVTGGAVGATTGAAAGAARGGAEGARRGITGLLGIRRKNNDNGVSQAADGGTVSSSSGDSSQNASSDTGTATTPPPTSNDYSSAARNDSVEGTTNGDTGNAVSNGTVANRIGEATNHTGNAAVGAAVGRGPQTTRANTGTAATPEPASSRNNSWTNSGADSNKSSDNMDKATSNGTVANHVGGASVGAVDGTATLSGSRSQAASSDAGTATTPLSTGSSVDIGTTNSNADTGAGSDDSGSVATPQVDNSSGNSIDSVAAPTLDSGAEGDYNAVSVTTPTVDDMNTTNNDIQREGSLFTRAYSAGRTVGGATGHPINTTSKAAWKAGSTKAKFDLAKQSGFKDEKKTAKAKVSEKVNDFFLGKYKDNNSGNGGKT